MKRFCSIIFSISLGLASMLNISAQILDVKKQDDPILRETCVEVTDFDEQLQILINDMTDTMEKHKGAGIAAPQVGKNIRAFIVKYDGEVTEYINPKITIKEGEQNSIEGCLSLPGLWGSTKRPKYIRGKAFDKFGEEFEFEAEGNEAIIICHEYDHLDGKLFTDSATITITSKQTMYIAAATLAGTAILGGILGYFIASYIMALF